MAGNVSYIRPEVTDQASKWSLVADCVEGEEKVKSETTTYLPKPRATDLSAENTTRYNQYVQRAVFYNVTNRTLQGLLGTVFATDPVVHVHEDMEDLMADVTGEGIPLSQQSRKAMAYGLMFGRGGLLADFPETEEGLSKADEEDGFVRPTIALYHPNQIINWRVTKRGARSVISLIVLSELYVAEDDGFEVKTKTQYRVLRLTDGVYTQEIVRIDENGNEEDATLVTPTDGAGDPFDHIPFYLFGAENNDTDVDGAPMYDIAGLNIAHYRNSADYEELVYVVGQPTPTISGLTKVWADKILSEGIQLGARAVVPLPVGGKLELTQVDPNTAAKEAMDQKEDQMLALGGKLTEPDSSRRTATEASEDTKSENSVLGMVAGNVSAAYTKALHDCALFMNLELTVSEIGSDGQPADVEIEYALNQEYGSTAASPESRNQITSEWKDGAITFSEMRDGLREAGSATMDDETARKELEGEAAIKHDREVALMDAAARAKASEGNGNDEPELPTN